MKLTADSRGAARKVPGVFRGPLLAWLALLAAAPAPGAGPDALSADDRARLRRGEILLQTLPAGKSSGAARVTALFNGEAEAVWTLIGYCEYQLIYIRGLSFCEMLTGDQYHMTMRHRVRIFWFAPALDFTMEARREPGGNGEARLLGGDLDFMEASWKLFTDRDAGGLVVTHEIRLKPRLPAPGWLVRRSLKKDLPAMLGCIRGLAGASGGAALAASDLGRCPGEVPASFK